MSLHTDDAFCVPQARESAAAAEHAHASAALTTQLQQRVQELEAEVAVLTERVQVQQKGMQEMEAVITAHETAAVVSAAAVAESRSDVQRLTVEVEDGKARATDHVAAVKELETRLASSTTALTALEEEKGVYACV